VGAGVGSKRTSSWPQDAANEAYTPSSYCRAWRDIAYSVGRGFEIGEDKLIDRALAQVRTYNSRKSAEPPSFKLREWRRRACPLRFVLSDR
jgi:hypothetical protein